MIILNGCANTAVKIAVIDSFCSGKYKSQRKLNEKDFNNLDKIRTNKSYKITIDKLTDNTTINEKEYEFCPINDGSKQTKTATRD